MLTRLQTAGNDPYRPQEIHQMGNCKGDAWPVPDSQGVPSTHLGLLLEPTTELDYGFGTGGDGNLQR